MGEQMFFCLELEVTPMVSSPMLFKSKVSHWFVYTLLQAAFIRSMSNGNIALDQQDPSKL